MQTLMVPEWFAEGLLGRLGNASCPPLACKRGADRCGSTWPAESGSRKGHPATPAARAQPTIHPLEQATSRRDSPRPQRHRSTRHAIVRGECASKQQAPPPTVASGVRGARAAWRAVRAPLVALLQGGGTTESLHEPAGTTALDDGQQRSPAPMRSPYPCAWHAVNTSVM